MSWELLLAGWHEAWLDDIDDLRLLVGHLVSLFGFVFGLLDTVLVGVDAMEPDDDEDHENIAG